MSFAPFNLSAPADSNKMSVSSCGFLSDKTIFHFPMLQVSLSVLLTREARVSATSLLSMHTPVWGCHTLMLQLSDHGYLDSLDIDQLDAIDSID